MKKPRLVNEQIYHIYNRGVEKRDIFLEENDYFRFIHDLFEFNDRASAEKTYYRKLCEVGPHKVRKSHENHERKLLIEILAFCLLPNHFHLLVRQKVDNGISKFVQKLGTGYSMYFNQKHKRVGPLFQGKFKAILVDKENHFIHLPFYIHLNPLDLIAPEWRNREIEDYQKALKFLKSYRWSSYLDYIGEKNFPSVTQRDFLLNFFGGQQNYKAQMEQWLKDMDLSVIEELVIE